MTFLPVYDWMFALGLNGNAVLVYSLVYSFTKAKGGYHGTTETTCSRLHITAPTLRDCYRQLIERGLIAKVQYKADRGNRFYYLARQFDDKGKEIFPYGETIPSAAFSPENKSENAQGERNFPLQGERNFPLKEKETFPYNKENIINNSSQENAPAREEGWKDEARASRMVEALRNGGTLRDDMVRGLSFGGVRIQAEKIVTLADQFVSLQRATGSDHTSDADFRSHFLRWATIQLKEEQAKRPRRSEQQPSEEEVRRRSEPLERWEENRRGAISYSEYLAMKAKGEI